ncbi:uncharacterized protein VTP21DRAFT_8290 [Calcarisporiella thermophila]|uniref:uncharacterized protein n=1 Tax=Calcarisporiella thermophila TaxID=911321 RepID=UPI003743EC6D
MSALDETQHSSNADEFDMDFEEIPMIDDTTADELEATARALLTREQNVVELDANNLINGTTNGKLKSEDLKNDETMKLKEELGRLKSEQQRIQNELYTKEGEITIIRNNMVKVEREKEFLRISLNEALQKAQSDQKALQEEFKKELDSYGTRLQFMTQELVSAKWNSEKQVEKLGSQTIAVGRSPSKTGLNKGPSKDQFLSESDFIMPPLLSKKMKSVGIMTESNLQSESTDMNVDQNVIASPSRPSKKEKTNIKSRVKRPLPMKDEKLELLQTLFLSTARKDQRQTHRCSNERSLHALIHDNMAANFNPTAEQSSQASQTNYRLRFQALSTELFECILAAVRTLDVETAALELVRVMHRFVDLSLESKCLGPAIHAVSITRALVERYKACQKYILSNSYASDFFSKHFDLLKQCTNSPTHSPPEAGLNLIVNTLGIFRALIWIYNREIFLRFRPLFVERIFEKLVVQGGEIAIESLGFLASLVQDKEFFEYLGPANSEGRKSAHGEEQEEEEINLGDTLARMLNDTTEMTIQSYRLKRGIIEVFSVACSYHEQAIAYFACQSQTVTCIATMLENLLDHIPEEARCSKLCLMLITDSINLLHLLFRGHLDLLRSQTDPVTTQQTLIVVLTRLAAAAEIEEAIGLEENVSEKARDILETILTPEQEDTIALLRQDSGQDS